VHVFQGDQVAGYAPLPQPVSQPYVAAGPVADPMVRATQSELIRLGYLHDTATAHRAEDPQRHQQFESASGLPVDGSPSSSLLARLQQLRPAVRLRLRPPLRRKHWVQPANAHRLRCQHLSGLRRPNRFNRSGPMTWLIAPGSFISTDEATAKLLAIRTRAMTSSVKCVRHSNGSAGDARCWCSGC